MHRTITTFLFLAVATASLSACDMAPSAPGKTATTKNIQVSSIHWDEVAAAEGAAHVTNNGLIMMR